MYMLQLMGEGGRYFEKTVSTGKHLSIRIHPHIHVSTARAVVTASDIFDPPPTSGHYPKAGSVMWLPVMLFLCNDWKVL